MSRENPNDKEKCLVRSLFITPGRVIQKITDSSKKKLHRGHSFREEISSPMRRRLSNLQDLLKEGEELSGDQESSTTYNTAEEVGESLMEANMELFRSLSQNGQMDPEMLEELDLTDHLLKENEKLNSMMETLDFDNLLKTPVKQIPAKQQHVVKQKEEGKRDTVESEFTELLQQALREAEAEVAHKDNQVSHLTKSNDELSAEVQRLRTENKKMQKQMQELTQSQNRLRDEMSTLDANTSLDGAFSEPLDEDFDLLRVQSDAPNNHKCQHGSDVSLLRKLISQLSDQFFANEDSESLRQSNHTEHLKRLEDLQKKWAHVSETLNSHIATTFNGEQQQQQQHIVVAEPTSLENEAKLPVEIINHWKEEKVLYGELQALGADLVALLKQQTNHQVKLREGMEGLSFAMANCQSRLIVGPGPGPATDPVEGPSIITSASTPAPSIHHQSPLESAVRSASEEEEEALDRMEKLIPRMEAVASVVEKYHESLPSRLHAQFIQNGAKALLEMARQDDILEDIERHSAVAADHSLQNTVLRKPSPTCIMGTCGNEIGRFKAQIEALNIQLSAEKELNQVLTAKVKISTSGMNSRTLMVTGATWLWTFVVLFLYIPSRVEHDYLSF